MHAHGVCVKAFRVLNCRLLSFLSSFSGVNLDDLDSETVRPTIKKKNLSDDEQYQEDLRFNNAMRETFLNRFVHMFSAYEHFVILPDQVCSFLMYVFIKMLFYDFI